jgi:hypothetical protein
MAERDQCPRRPKLTTTNGPVAQRVRWWSSPSHERAEQQIRRWHMEMRDCGLASRLRLCSLFVRWTMAPTGEKMTAQLWIVRGRFSIA